MKRLTWITIVLAVLIAACAVTEHPFIDRESRSQAAMPPPVLTQAAPPPPPRYESEHRPGTHYIRGPATGSAPPPMPAPPPPKVESSANVSGTVPAPARPPRAPAIAEAPPATDVDQNDAAEAIKTWPFLGQLRKADIAFNTPGQMKMGEKADLQLIIDPTKTSEEIKQAITAEGAKFGATVHVSKVVVAKLLAPDFDTIELVNRGKQAIDFSGPTEWRWIITPKKEGSHKIHLTISAVVEVGSDRAERFIKSFDHEITVIVTPTDRMKGLVEKHWQWGFSSLLVPLGVWLWKRRKEKQA